MNYIEFGLGNTWVITELENGTEFEEKGIKGPIKFQSFIHKDLDRQNSIHIRFERTI